MTIHRLIAASAVLLTACGSPLYLERKDGSDASADLDSAFPDGYHPPDDAPQERAGLGGAGSGGAGAGGGSGGTIYGTAGATGAGGTTASGGAPGTGGKVVGAGGAMATGGAAGTGGRGTGGQVDTQSDGKNCGAIGHDCLGGACAAGQCQPVLVAQYLGDAISIAMGPDVVCVTVSAGDIGCAKKDGSDLRDFAYPDQTTSALLGARPSVDGNRLIFGQYLSGSGFRLAICDIGNCEASTLPFGNPYTQYSAIDPVAHRIYWVDGTNIYWSSTAGTPQAKQLPFDPKGGTLGAAPILYSRNNILFTSWDTNGTSIYRVAINANGTPTTAVLVGSGTASATNDEFVFWYEADGLRSVPLPNGIGGGSNLILAGVTGVNLAADRTSIYWTASPSVGTCSISDCAGTRRTLPIGPSTAMDVAFRTYDLGVDDSAVFWASGTLAQEGMRNATKVFKLAK